MTAIINTAAASLPEAAAPLADIRGLNVRFGTDARTVHAVRDLDLSLEPGEVRALVGESGSGKSATGLALMGLHGPSAQVTGQIRFNGTDLHIADERAWQRLRGRRIAMVFQNSTAALNPLLTIGTQLIRLLRLDRPRTPRATLLKEAGALLEMVGLDDPTRRLAEYPHQFSGGMNQRIGIAMALARQPDLLIADEPTTALDVSIQAQIIDLLGKMARERQLAVLFITHDLSLVSQFCRSVSVMYGGSIVETGPVTEVFARPRHRYTQALLDSMPSLSRRVRLTAIPGDPPLAGVAGSGCAFAPRCAAATAICQRERPALQPEGQRAFACYHPPQTSDRVQNSHSGPARTFSGEPVISVRNAALAYAARGFFRRSAPPNVLHDVSLDLHKGEVLGLVGESGSGKSSLARLIMGQVKPQSGAVLIEGTPRPPLDSPQGRALSQRIQLVFQDSLDALDPSMTLEAQLEEPLQIHGMGSATERRERIEAIASAVGLPAGLLSRRPREISGGQRQRVVLARALVLRPRILVCDEPVASLDVSVQAQVINLLDDLRHQLGLTILFISHDLRLVAHLCDRVAVMHRGRIVETGACDAVFGAPAHDYTRRLLAALPRMNDRLPEAS